MINHKSWSYLARSGYGIRPAYPAILTSHLVNKPIFLQLNGDRVHLVFEILLESQFFHWLDIFVYLFFSVQRIPPNAPTQPVSFFTTRACFSLLSQRVNSRGSLETRLMFTMCPVHSYPNIFNPHFFFRVWLPSTRNRIRIFFLIRPPEKK